MTLGVLGVFGAAMLMSNASAVPERQEASKKFVKKRINKLRGQVPGLVARAGNPIFIEEDELDRFGPIRLSVGQNQAIGTYGPFTLTAQCLDNDPGAGVVIQGRVRIQTTEDNSSFMSYYGDQDDDFDTAEDRAVYIQGTDAPGDPQDQWTYGDGFFRAAAPSGRSIWGTTDLITNFSGAHCWFVGQVLVN